MAGFTANTPTTTESSTFSTGPTFTFSVGTPTTRTSAFGEPTTTHTSSNSGSIQGFSSGTGTGLVATPGGFGQQPTTQLGTGLFGQTTSTSSFGQPPDAQSFPTPFGTSIATPGFASSIATPILGTSTATRGFGTSIATPGFGISIATLGFGTSIATPGFGTMAGNSLSSPFGQVQTDALTKVDFQEKSSNSGTSTVKFSIVQGTDCMVKNGITSNISVRHQCITLMSNYDKKSLEELRLEDYEAQGRVKRLEKSFDFERALTVSSKIYICSTHNEALKVYCHTDKCLICIYCQFYGNHVGHECEFVTDIATTIREELGSVSEKLSDHLELMKKSRDKVINTKDSVLDTEEYLQDRIGKHMASLHAYMTKGETTLRGAVNAQTNQKIVSLDNQERAMSGIVNKCELAFSLIEKCQKNDSALVDEKPNIFSLVDEVSAFIEKRELEPAETDNLTCSFEYNLFDLLKTQIGGVKMLKPGQKESDIYGFNEHEKWGDGKTKDAEVQTEDPQLEGTAHHSQHLMETSDSSLAAQVWENSPTDVNEKGGLDCSGDKSDDDDENELGLEVVEGESLFPVEPTVQVSIDPQSSGEVISELPDELPEKVDRLAVVDGADDDSTT